MGKTVKRTFKCQVCGEITVADPTQECGASLLTGEKPPTHHGQPMYEVVDLD
jgi:hypothetical protein